MSPRPPRSFEPSTAEAGAWADVLVRRRLANTEVLAPTGQWLVQHQLNGPIQALTGSAVVVEQAATIPHSIRSTRPDYR